MEAPGLAMMASTPSYGIDEYGKTLGWADQQAKRSPPKRAFGALVHQQVSYSDSGCENPVKKT
jgi:hypothetical protein